MTKKNDVRRLFEEDPRSEIWIGGKPQYSDSKILLTVSNSHGEETVLITPDQVVTSNPKMFVQAPPERVLTPEKLRQKKYKNWITNIGYVLSAILITFSLMSAAGFVKARIVLTGSMAPKINSGDIVILEPTTHVTPKIGDVVAYTGKRFDGSSVGTFTHRIIGGDPISGFTVKGDANPSPDVQKPTIKDVTGKVVFVIPSIGKFLMPKNLMIIAPIALGAWLIFDTIMRGGA